MRFLLPTIRLLVSIPSTHGGDSAAVFVWWYAAAAL